MKKLIISLLVAVQYLNAQQLVSNFKESEYESIERVFANNTGHIDNLVEFIQRNALLQNQKKAFLDIGAGPATITERLSKFFKSTTVVEPNQEYEPLYKEKGFVPHIGNFQDIAMDHQYDLVLCSHVLYHIPHSEWSAFLKKLNRSIRPGGKGVVLLVAPKGEFHTLRTSINPEYSNISRVEKILNEEKIPYDLTLVPSTFKVPNYEDFRALIRLFTIDDCFLPETYQLLSDSEKEAIDQKIERYIAACRQSDGSYDFYDVDGYIVMHKE